MPISRPAVPAKCLKCEADLTSPIVCTGCRTLYPMPASLDYFELLGLQRQFDISDDKLMAAFRAMARRIHPDRFTGQTEEARTLSTRLSAQLNQAVGVLRDPVTRASYLLDLASGPSASDVRSVPPDVLADVMALREELEQAQTAGDQAVLERLRGTATERRANVIGQLSASADRLAAAADDEKHQFRELINSIKYFDTLLGELAVDPLAATSRHADA